MSLIKRFTPSPAMVIGCLALLLTLGGTGYAASKALPRNSVGSIQVKDHSLLARDFKAGQLPRGRRPVLQGPPVRRARPARRRLAERRVEVGARPARRRHRRAVRRHHARGASRAAARTSSASAAP